MSRVLIAGASGHLGRHVVEELSARGHRTRALIRDPAKLDLLRAAEETVVIDLLNPGVPLADAVDGVDVVFSAAGQPCTMQRIAERRSFLEVDPHINRALLHAAVAAGVSKFAYVAVLAPRELRDLAYVAAHETFVDDLLRSGIDYTVVRANGFFSSYLDLLAAARRGSVPSLGKGSARSNPIHDADLARACVDALEGGSLEIEIGGPEPIGRHEEIEMTFDALDRKPRVRRPPGAALKVATSLMRVRDRRRAEMLEFLTAIGRADLIAPSYGEHRLRDYLREQAN